MDNNPYEPSTSPESFASRGAGRQPRPFNPMMTIALLLILVFVLALFTLVLAPAFL
jgi:hypothetical protein